jgi:hypothetical protein
MSIRPVLTRLGGLTKVARELNHKNVTTVQGWWDRDVIPARRQLEVLELGKRLGKPIDPIELMPSPAEAE